jgi:insertion element IS1 protein InsB
MLFRSSSKACGHQFVVYADNRAIAEDQRTLVERLLLEKISLHGICRTVGVSIRRLADFMITRFQALPDHPHAQPVTPPHDVLMGRLD